METKEEVTVQTVGGMEVKYKKVFSISDEELKAFYLKQAVLYAPTYCTPNCSEYHLLCILREKYKRVADFLNRLNSKAWALNTPALHEVFMPYILDNTIPKKKRRDVCNGLSEHVHFLSILVGNQSVSKELYRFYNENLKTLKHLMKLYYPDRAETDETDERI